MTDWNAVPIFGVSDSRLPHVIRLSAYGLVVDAADELAIVRTPTGTYLPGGGMRSGESAEAAVGREAREECGLEVQLTSWRRAAIDHVAVPSEESCFEKRSTFCSARVLTAVSGSTEPDHLLAWETPAVALRVLTPPSHRWAVAEWLADRDATLSQPIQ